MRANTKRYSEVESLERKAANAIGRKNSNRAPKKTREELMAFVFGGPTPTVITKSKVELTKENLNKYNLIAQGFCTISTKDLCFNGRFSKLENSRNQTIDDSSVVNFYNCKTREYVDVNLTDVTSISANKTVTNF